MYQVVFQFQSLEDLISWDKRFGKLANKKPVTNESDKPDNRGSKTKEIHAKQKNIIKQIQLYLILNAL